MSAQALTLHTLLGDYRNTVALKRGEVTSPLVNFDFAAVKTANRAFKRVVRDGEFQVAELALVTYLQAKAYGKPLVLIPAVIGEGRFQHHCLVYNRERGVLGVGDLAGKRIGIRAHAQTTVTWVRGILSDDYGVDLDSVRWVTFEDGHLAEFDDPPGIERAPAGRTAAEMLLAGELDAAIIGSDLPDDPRLAPVIPNPHEAAAKWAARHGALPINHMMTIEASLCQERPDVVREIYRVLQESKRLAGPIEGRDLTPFGVEANRAALGLITRYAYEQKLIPRLYSVDELFDDVTRVL
jgi:4,5-dihydroxyphthalate decarboxylase